MIRIRIEWADTIRDDVPLNPDDYNGRFVAAHLNVGSRLIFEDSLISPITWTRLEDS